MKVRIKNNNIKTDDLSVYNDGAKFSYKGNMYHNIDGPTREHSSGDETWWSEDNLHRRYGPARKWRSGDDEWWYFEGMVYSQEEFMEKFL